jgi:hypothetical protein
MDAQELRNLQEAYMEVVENQQLDEELTGARAKRAEKKGFKRLARGQEGSRVAKNIRGGNLPTKRGGGGEKGQSKVGMRSAIASDQGSGNKSKRRQGKNVADTRADRDYDYDYANQYYDESYDIYDIILSHLLDEGYAETPEAAEAIMVNMSEEWRDSIIG